jgi:geranylgeranyl diphosphate synthase, type II
LLSDQEGEPADLIACARLLAEATGVQGMVGGQYIDVAGTASSDAEGLRHLHELKTGRLIGASVECPLLVSGAHKSVTISSFRTFANELGVLFQIVDDILDVTGSDVTLGKPQGSDERLGKRTYVTEYGLEGARKLAEQSHQRARAALAGATSDGAAGLEQITDFIAYRSF